VTDLGSDSENQLLREVVDFVMPVLPPYETSLYLLLLRLGHLESGAPEVCIGKRSISQALGRSTRSSGGNYRHITEKLQSLAESGFIEIGDTDRLGTRYLVKLPNAVPMVRERMAESLNILEVTLDHYGDPTLRLALFERDKWRCRYCGITVTTETASLDHMIPVSKGGEGTPDNLATCCMMCNSIKSGRTYEEAAPQILSRLAALRAQEAT
jgi:hypothetical protein